MLERSITFWFFFFVTVAFSEALTKSYGGLDPEDVELAPADTVVAFTSLLPPVRVPVAAWGADEPEKGAHLLAFSDEAAWRSSWGACQRSLQKQCEVWRWALCQCLCCLLLLLGCHITSHHIAGLGEHKAPHHTFLHGPPPRSLVDMPSLPLPSPPPLSFLLCSLLFPCARLAHRCHVRWPPHPSADRRGGSACGPGRPRPGPGWQSGGRLARKPRCWRAAPLPR